VSRLVAIRQIQGVVARRAESAARKEAGGRKAALESAQYEILLRAGCYGTPFAPTVGWVCSRDAAVAIAESWTNMPDKTRHHRFDFRYHGETL
jgi:hypothetical protein